MSTYASFSSSFNISEPSYCTLIQSTCSVHAIGPQHTQSVPRWSISLSISPSLPVTPSLSSIALLLRIIKYIKENAARLRRRRVSHESCGSSTELNYERTPEEKEIVSIFFITKEWRPDDIASPNGECIALAREMRRIIVELFHVNRVSAYSFLGGTVTHHAFITKNACLVTEDVSLSSMKCDSFIMKNYAEAEANHFQRKLRICYHPIH